MSSFFYSILCLRLKVSLPFLDISYNSRNDKLMKSHTYISYVITRADSIAKSKTGFFLELSNNRQADGSSIELTERIKHWWFFSFTFKFGIHGLYNSFDVVNVHEFSLREQTLRVCLSKKYHVKKTD